MKVSRLLGVHVSVVDLHDSVVELHDSVDVVVVVL